MPALRTAFLILLSCPTYLGAQEPGTLVGTVTSVDDAPLAHAQVSVSGTRLGAETGADGSFKVGGLPSGTLTIEVKMIGYAPIGVPVEIAAGQTLFVRVKLAVEPVQLEPVQMMAEPAVPLELRGFHERKARGVGTFFTREEIARIQPRLFTDVLRRVPGMQVGTEIGTFGTNNAVRSTRATGVAGARPCPVLFYLDGSPFPVTGDIPINNFIAPAEIAAVEVYSGASQTPVQFLSNALNARCGVIVIWTVSGRNSRR